MNKKMTLKWLLGASLMLGLTACSNDDEEVVDEEITGPNLTISQIDANNLHVYAMGETLVVDYQLETAEFSGVDVTVDFYLVHSESADEEEITETHYLSSIDYVGLETGSLIDSFAVEVPNVEHSGDYWIVAVVDPENEVIEVNEEDNHPNIDNEAHVAGDFPTIVIQIEAGPEHEFDFKEAYIDGGLVVLDSPEVHEGTGEHHSDIIGHLDAIYHGDHAATAELTAEVLIDGVYQATELWDQESHDYVAAQSIVFEYDGEEHFFGFDVGLSDAQLESLYASYDSSAQTNDITIRLTLTDTTAAADEEVEHNNAYEITVPLYFFEKEEEEEQVAGFAPTPFSSGSKPGNHAKGLEFTGNKLKIDGSYDKSYGDASKFKVGVDLGGELQVDLLEKAASVEAGGSVDMWLFNAKNTIFAISYDGQAYVTGLNTGYDSEMIIFNTTVFEDSYWNAQFEKTFEKSWEEERVLAQARFTVGPIPITIKAGVDGSVGFELIVGYKLSELYANGDIFSTNFGGFANGGVDLGLASAGVVVALKILENVLALDASAELALLDGDQVDPRVDYSFELTDDLDVISGRFGLYADVKSVKWCKKWGIPYPCGSKTKTYYLWFYQTPSVYKKNWTLFSKEGSISI